MMSDPVIRTAKPADIAMMAEWAAAEGWNPGLEDAEAFYAADREGFLIAEQDGQPVACISVVRYDAAFGFLGFYICKPEFRGRGIGWSVWQAGIDYLAGCTVGLDGVVEQQDNYRKSGFVYAHGNMRYQGLVDLAALTQAGIVAVDDDLFPALAVFDRVHFPADREAFLRHWLFGAKSRSGRVLVENGRITGYGVIRACRDGFKIGPLFAETPEGADRLFRALCATQPGAPVILDVPVPNPAAIALAERYGLSPVFETARMYRGTSPDLPLSAIYGITTFELG